MNWDQFKDLVCYKCLAGSMVTQWSPTQKVASLNNPFNYKYFYHVIEFVDNILENSNGLIAKTDLEKHISCYKVMLKTI